VLLRRGDVVLIGFAPARPAEADYVRPAVVVTNNQANAFAPVVTVVPLTSNVTKIYPVQLFLPAQRSGLDRDSKAQVELLRHASLERIQKTLGRLPDDLMAQLDARLREHLAL
jgi:mRNA interferase MazF